MTNPEATAEASAAPESTAEAGNNPPPAPVESAPPAPIRSVASGDVLPSINPAGDAAQVCISLYEDVNADRVQETAEVSLPGGVITLTGASGVAGEHAMDTSPEPYCFADLVAGEYTASMQAPQGYGLTTPAQLTVQAIAGAKVNLAFGAAQGVLPVTPPPAEELVNVNCAGRRSPNGQCEPAAR